MALMPLPPSGDTGLGGRRGVGARLGGRITVPARALFLGRSLSLVSSASAGFGGLAGGVARGVPAHQTAVLYWLYRLKLDLAVVAKIVNAYNIRSNVDYLGTRAVVATTIPPPKEVADSIEVAQGTFVKTQFKTRF